MRHMFRLTMAALLFLGLLSISASASQLYTCQSCTNPVGGDPFLITNPSSFDVGSAGNHATVGPLLIIVGTYDGAPAPTLHYGTHSYTPGGAAVYGWNGSATAVPFDATEGSESAYAELGIEPEGGGSSEQFFPNWVNGDTANGITAATTFNLYVYEIPVALPASPGNITLSLTGATAGSYVIGYACEAAGTPCPNGKEDSTPFTNAGLIGRSLPPPVPEPSSLVLFGSGLIGMGTLVRRKMRL